MQVDGDNVDKLADFGTLAKQIAKVKPSQTAMSAYQVTNTAAAACPTIGSDWAASSDLPPIANSDVCDCMVKSLSCVSKDGMTGEEIATQFNYVCGQDADACVGINANATTGKYGAYSMCTSQQKLSFAFNQYYQHQNGDSTACDFSGNAQTQSGSTDGNCGSLIKAAGSDGTGTVTAVPTSGGSSSGSSSGGSAATSTGAAMGSVIIPQFEIGTLSMGAYVMGTVLAGMGMIML